MNHYNGITLLITHYNRSSSLERLLASFDQLGCAFEDIIVSDDGSKDVHIKHILSLRQQYAFRLITAERNKGLGNNINKGQDAVKTPYTLYVQEDFVPKPAFSTALDDAVNILEARPDVDMIRFYAYFRYPYLEEYRNGFSEMKFRLLSPGYRKFYYYSDHPHLRRSSFFEKFGRYREDRKVEATEYAMMMSFLQNKGKALFYNNYQDLFEQRNSQVEPSTVKRNFWRENKNGFIAMTRHLYRHVRFNADYLFSRYRR